MIMVAVKRVVSGIRVGWSGGGGGVGIGGAGGLGIGSAGGVGSGDGGGVGSGDGFGFIE